jgi:hypothetical protein
MCWVVTMTAQCDTCRKGWKVDVPLRLEQAPPLPDGWRSDGTTMECPRCYAERVRPKPR